MDSKIFLGKYRVAADEIGAVGDLTNSPLAYEGEEIDSGKKVVVEAVPATSLKAVVRERLEAEAIAAKKLSHVNIPALCDFGVENDHFVYVTENVEGTVADEWVNAHGPMPEGPVLRIAAQVVSALGAAAFHRINHHAINPNNLVLVPGQTAEGEWPLVKVLHFVGIAPEVPGTDVAVAAFDKSLHYASPEQVKTGTVDFRSEIYSLGCTMWFLLTGAPPLLAPGSTAVPAPTAGLAEEKTSAMSRKTRRLLTQMLAVNPEDRPGDPLAFYRKLQDCLNQVERRETMARKFGIPAFSPTGVPPRWRIPVKALALAALFLAITTVAALVVSGQLRHRRIVNAEEPIGKPIGVPDASTSVSPVTANTNAIASNTAPPAAVVVESKNAPAAPPLDAKPPPAIAPLPSAGPAVIASTSEVEVPPAPPAVSGPPKDPLSQEPAAAAAVTASALPPDTDSRAVASNKQAGPTPGDWPPPDPVAQETESKKIVMREVRRAEPADDEPEVRRAEPVPSEQGHESAAATTPPDSDAKAPAKSLAKKTDAPAKPKGPAEKKSEPAPPEEGPEIAGAEATSPESEPSVPGKSPEKKLERAANSKRQAEKRKGNSRQTTSESNRAPRLQQRSGRARLVGVTPEGWWMLELPSNRIIVVPPPPSSR